MSKRTVFMRPVAVMSLVATAIVIAGCGGGGHPCGDRDRHTTSQAGARAEHGLTYLLAHRRLDV